MRSDEAKDGRQTLLAVDDLSGGVPARARSEEDDGRQRDAAEDGRHKQLRVGRQPCVTTLVGGADVEPLPPRPADEVLDGPDTGRRANGTGDRLLHDVVPEIRPPLGSSSPRRVAESLCVSTHVLDGPGGPYAQQVQPFHAQENLLGGAKVEARAGLDCGERSEELHGLSLAGRGVLQRGGKTKPVLLLQEELEPRTAEVDVLRVEGLARSKCETVGLLVDGRQPREIEGEALLLR